MRKFMLYYPVFLMLLISSCQNMKSHEMVLTLDQGWFFKQYDMEDWFPASVPGCIHTDLLFNQQIDDPFWRLNEHDLQWIDKEDWEYKNHFIVKKSLFDKDNIELRFEGIDTYADIFLNDHLILQADNMFREWNIDVKDYIKVGENELKVKLKSPIKEGINKLESIPYTITVSGNDLSELGGIGDKRVSIFTRKAPYHYGWDWGPRLVTSGIWRPVHLFAWDEVSIRNIFIKQEFLSTGQADLIAFIEIESTSELTSDITIYVNSNETFNREYEIIPGENTIGIPFQIGNPKLWWPNGMGDQVLYNIEVQINHNNQLLSKEALLNNKVVSAKITLVCAQ